MSEDEQLIFIIPTFFSKRNCIHKHGICYLYMEFPPLKLRLYNMQINPFMEIFYHRSECEGDIF